MTTKALIKTGRSTALISFLIGTVIMGIYYQSSSSALLFYGYAFILLAGLMNLIVLIALLVRAANDKEDRKKLFATSRLMLLNIPVLIAYIWFTLMLLGTMRITFTNDTGTGLTDIQVIGCGGGHIDHLRPGESSTVWVPIPGDCSISLSYLSEGQRKGEAVAGYVTSSMGQKLDHRIDGKDKDLL